MMKKIGFVVPWFSEKISGGAEIALRDLTQQLFKRGVALEILTTCVEKFSSDWSVNYFLRGISEVNGIPVRRFRADKRYWQSFDAVNLKLMDGKAITADEESIYLNEMVNSDELCDYIREHKSEYSLFVFIPYMFGTTYFGSAAAGKQAVLIPCLHDEPYAYISLYRKRFSQVAGMAFLSEEESRFAHKTYDLSQVKAKVLGLGVDAVDGDGMRFRQKHGLGDIPFILYAGRKDHGKNVPALLEHFAEYQKNDTTGAKLVLIGGGSIEIPEAAKKKVLDLGFVSAQEKADAYHAATVLCQPSLFESFSVVIMESWLAGRPVLVSKHCTVTSTFAKQSGGGFSFADYTDFKQAMDVLLKDKKTADAMGRSGCQFVQEHFNWDSVINAYMEFFKSLCPAE